MRKFKIKRKIVLQRNRGTETLENFLVLQNAKVREKHMPSFSLIANVFFRQMVCPSDILLGQINDIICEILMRNVHIPWMKLKPQVSPSVTKEVTPL